MTWLHLLRASASTLWISAPTLVEAGLGRLSLERCDRRLLWWADRLLKQARMTVVVEGTGHLSDREHYVVMSNHQSLYDIPVVFHSLRRRVRMVTKSELFRVPVWGRAMRSAGFVEVDRRDHEQAMHSLERAEQAIQSGIDIWISPEGTRSRDGGLGEFRKGGFHLAMEARAKILPVTIVGTRDVLPARGNKVRPGVTVFCYIHAPIPTLGVSLSDLMLRVRRAIQGPLVEAKASH